MKKSISIVLVVAMLFSYMPGLDNLMYSYGQETVGDYVYEEKTTAEDVYEKEIDTENIEEKEVEEVIKKLEIQPLMEEKQEVDYKSVIDDALKKLKNYYKENEVDYISAMAYHHSSDHLDQDMKIIEKNLRTYSLESKNVYNAYKGIMEAIACGQDPRNFECDGKAFNYVDTLIKMQKATGEFDEDIIDHAYCMLALDMACGEYNVEKAIEVLTNKLEKLDDKAYIKEGYRGDVKKTAMVMLALSNHKDINGVEDLIKKCINYIKSSQDKNAGFYQVTPVMLGSVIQALIAVGEDPLAGDYVKNGKTMIDVLIKNQMADGTYVENSWYKRYHKDSTEVAFAALADLNKKKSMYHTLKIELGDTPSQIEIKADKTKIIKGKSTKLQAKVLDDKNRLVTGQKIKWTSSDENIATVENGVVTAKEKGKVTITAELEGNSTIKKPIDIVVQDRNPSSIKIYLENKEVTDKLTIKKDEMIQFSAKIFDQDHEEMKEKKVTWSIEGNIYASIDHEGKVTGISKGNTVINATYESIKASASIDVILMTDVVKDVLDEVQTYYKDKSKYTYLEALSLSYMGVDKKIIQEKLEIIDKPSYLIDEQDYAKNIIALISAGLDPRDYNGKNYVDELVKSQKNSGYFSIGSNYRRIENIVLPMSALDMADAKYNVNQCINILKTSAKSSKNTRYFETMGDYSEVEITTLAIIAMSKHKAEAGDLFNQCRGYLKEKQNKNAAFEVKSGGYGSYASYKENCKATASVIQALIAVRENPLKGDWVKNNKTIFDALLSFKKENKFKENSSDYLTNDEATACAFAALVDLYKNKSMYHAMKMEIGTVPHNVEILGDQYYVKEGQTLKLRAKVTDIDGKLVPEQIIEWTSSNPTIATIDEKGLVTGKDISQDQKIIIKAKIKDKGIEITKDIVVKARIPHEIKVELPKNQKDNNLKEGKQLALSKKVLEEDGEELKEDVIWSSSDENIATVDETGLVTAKEVQKDTKVTITVTSKSKDDVKRSIELNIIAVIPEKIEILFEDKAIDETTIESGYKLKIDVKAYEKDKSLIENAEIEWTGSDQNVATIENGIITAKDVKEEKNIQITAKVKGFEAEKKLNLKVIPIQTNEQKTQRAIDDLKKYYERNIKYGYLQAMAFNRIGLAQDKIKQNLDIQKLTFTKGKWNDTQSGEYSKAIMAMIAAGIDPTDYKGKDCVKYLADSQVEKGYFDASGYYYSKDKEADHIAYSIIALDMVGGEYNIDKALEALKGQFTITKDQAYVKGNLEKTAIALIALSNHTDKEGINDLVNKIKVYMKEQYDKWDDKTNSKDMANTIQALIAIGEDPLSESYTKKDQYGNKVTMLDSLLNLKTEKGFKNSKKFTYMNEETTALAFAAITDLYTGKSMYKEKKVKKGAPEKVEIQAENDQKELKVGKKLKLSAKALDKDGKFLPSQTFTWSISNPSIATIDANTGEVTAIGSGTVVITAMVKDFKNIKNTFELKIINDENVEKDETSKKIKEEIEFLNKAYKEKKIVDYLSSLSGNLSGLDKQLIQSKLPENKRADRALFVSKQIMCLIGAGLDPRGALIEKDEVRNFVYELTSSQVKDGENKGEFILKDTDKNSIEALAYSIIALDMADGKYDKEAAVKRLLQMLKDKNSKTYNKVTTEALVLTALSKHKDIDGVKETIKNLMDFLKSKQNEDGGFDTKSISLGLKNSTIATGRVIQALVANGVDPIHGKEWTKNDKTLLDGLLKNKVVQENLARCGYGKGKGEKNLHSDSTHQAFAALVDLYNHQSMFEKLAIQYNGAEVTSKEKIDKLIEAVKSYYQTDYFRQNQGQLNSLETATLKRAGVDVSKWSTDVKYTTSYDQNLKNLSNIIKQVDILLDVQEDPKNFEGRNLVKEIADKLDDSTNPYEYMNGVSVLDKYNEQYPDQKVVYNIEKNIKKIISNQQEDGGFKLTSISNPRTTGDALLALSKHKDIEGVEESIKKATNYLRSIQKEDGGLYDTAYITGYHADIVRGLLSVGEDVRSEKWTKAGKNPVDALFILWKKNNSFDNKEGESINNRGWIEATQKALYALADLKEAGYGDYYVKDVKVSTKIQEPEKTYRVYTAIVVPENGKYVAYSKPQKVTISTKEHTGGCTVLGALQATTTLYKAIGGFVTEIYGIQNKGMGGWMFTLNGEISNDYADKAVVKDGDQIIWYYSPEGMEGKTPKWEEIEGEIHNELKLIVDGLSDQMIVNKEEIVFTAKASEKDAKVIVKLGDKIIESKDHKYKVCLQNGENNITIESVGKEGKKVQNVYNVIYQTSSKFATKLIEYTPAPGQFTNTDSFGTLKAAESTLNGKSGLVSLGAFGGYIVYGFDSPIKNNKGACDFKVYGNAFAGNSEPAGIAVMKDTNKNGLADDTWYYLSGSEYNKKETIKDYKVTYQNQGSEKDVKWIDNQGNSGVIKQNSYHTQNYYPSKENFPHIDPKQYTLSGIRIDTRTPKWGYADVTPNGDEMNIDWAVDENGNQVDLDEIDFVKVYTAVQMDAGQFGEVSAEVAGIEILDEIKDNQKQITKVEVTCEKVTSKEVTLKFCAKDSLGIDYYKVFRDDFEKEIAISKTDAYIDQTVEPNKSYQYKIKAVDLLGNESEFSKILVVKTLSNESGNGGVTPPNHKSIKVNVRVEGNKSTIIQPQKIYLSESDLDLKKYGIDRSYKDYRVIHPTIKVLEERGIRYNCENSNYNFLTMIDGLKMDTIKEGKDGWMYYVNHQFANRGLSEYAIHDGDSIVWFFIEDYTKNWYTWFDKEEVKTKTGEDITLILKGSHYDMNSNSTSNGAIQDATILVNNEKYKWNGEEIKTDKDGKAILKFNQAGTYYISAERVKGSLRDISRPYCKIVVEGSTVLGGRTSGTGGISNEDYKKLYDKVIDPKSNEQDVKNATKEAGNKLDKKSNAIHSEKDAQNVVSDAKDVTKIIDQATNRVITEEGAKEVAKESIKVVNILTKSTQKLSKDDDKKEVVKVVTENMKATIKAIDKMNNTKEINKVAGDMIDTSGKLIKNIGNKNEQKVIESTIQVAKKAVKKANTKEMTKDKMTIEKDKIIAKIDENIIKEISKNTPSTVKVMNEKLKSNGIEGISLENKVVIQIPKVGQKEVEAVLPANIMKIVKENKVEKVAVQTENAVFNITPNTLAQKETALSAKTMDRNDLTALQKNKVPKGCVVVDLNAKAEGEKINKFNEPMRISIPYKGEVKKGETVQAFYLKDNGTIENMGGVYDPATKMVTFETTHFSKYFAKKVGKEEVKVTFNDLVGYEWAKDAIEEMAQRGIISGRSEDVFDPSAYITRAEFATLITKMLGINIENEKLSFTDVEDTAWYTPYIKTAYKNGLVSGRSTTIFDLNGKITREEMATIIGKVLTQTGKEKANINELERFSDKTNIATWANENVSLCVKEKIISGMPDGTFMPKENANRAQAAVMLNHLYHNIQ